MAEEKYVSRDEVAKTDTPSSTQTWRPVPHIDVIEAVTNVIKAHNWDIEGEKFGLAREGQKMFGKRGKDHTDPAVSLDAVCEQMGRTPPWAEGLLLRADGYECAFYQKD